MVTKKREFTVVVERGEDGQLIGTVPELKGCHSQGRTLDELLERVKEAIQLCLEVEGEDGRGLDLVGVHTVTVALQQA